MSTNHNATLTTVVLVTTTQVKQTNKQNKNKQKLKKEANKHNYVMCRQTEERLKFQISSQVKCTKKHFLHFLWLQYSTHNNNKTQPTHQNINKQPNVLVNNPKLKKILCFLQPKFLFFTFVFSFNTHKNRKKKTKHKRYYSQ